MDNSGLGLIFQLGTVLALVFVNGFFVAAEFSLVTVRRSQIEELVNSGNRGARRVEGLLKDLDTLISSTQLGVTMAGLALGWLGEPFVARLIAPLLSFLPNSAILPTTHTIASIVAFVLITYLTIVLGEICPKSISLQRPVATAMAVAGPMKLFTRLLYPFTMILNTSARIILQLLGMHGTATGRLVHSEEELRILLNESQESGVLEEEETEIIQRVFDFSDMTARQVMVPRTEMVCIPVSATLDEVLDIILRESYSRYPVYGSSIDDIVGIVQVKDIMPILCTPSASFDLKAIMRTPLIAPEMIHLDQLLNQFRRYKTHMAVLVDEFGGTAGLVTMQDLLEEIVGEMSEGLEEDELDIEPQDDGSYLVNGKLLLTDVKEHFGLDLDDPHFVTLGGLVFNQIGRRPRVGDEVTLAGARLRVEALDGLRVKLVRLMFDKQNNKQDDEQGAAQTAGE